MTRRESIAAVREIAGRLHFEPTPRFRALGFAPRDLGPAGPLARMQVDDLFRQCRIARQQDKKLRAISRSARLAIGHDS